MITEVLRAVALLHLEFFGTPGPVHAPAACHRWAFFDFLGPTHNVFVRRDVEELGFVESQPKQDGRNMIMVIGPHRRKSDSKAERAVPREGGSQAERPTRVRRPPAPSAAEAREAADSAAAEAGQAEPESTEPASVAEAEAEPARQTPADGPRATYG